MIPTETPEQSPDLSSPETSLPDPSGEKPSKSPVWPWVLGGALLLGGGYFGWQRMAMAPAGPPQGMQGMPPAAVKWEVLSPQVVAQSSVFMGTLEAQQGTAIAPEVEGRIVDLLVREGQRVEKGQVLFRLDNNVLQTEWLEAQATLAQETARLEELQAGTRSEDIALAQAQLRQAQSRLANAQGGASPEEIAQAQAQLNAAQAAADLANERVKRFAGLRDQGVIPLDTYDQQVKEQRQAIANVEVAKRRLAEVTKARRSEVDTLTAEVEAERQNLSRLENGERPENIAQAKARVAQAQARLKTLEARLAKTEVRAPFDGVVGYIPVKSGDFVRPGDRLTNLTENQTLDLNVAVPLAQAARLRKGLTVQILGPQDSPIATGQISFISPDVENDGQTILARAAFSNGDRLLNQQLVQARIIWEEAPALVVPAPAISRIGDKTFVYVVQQGKDEKTGDPQLTAQQKAVTLGPIQDNGHPVLEGLNPGEKVITAGLLKLQDGAPIRPASATESP